MILLQLFSKGVHSGPTEAAGSAFPKIMAEKEVFDIKPIASEDGNEGYEVIIKDSTKFFKKTRQIRASGIVISGGVMGTLKLLLNLKKSSPKRLPTPFLQIINFKIFSR